MDPLVQKLNELYQYETWHKERLDETELTKYHDKLLSLGNIITVSDGELLVGYVEFWRLTYEQFGRIVCGEPFSGSNEDVQTGQIAYVANTYIRPEYRQGSVYKIMRDRFFKVNKLCTHFVGHARRKKSEPVKVFKTEKLMSLNKVEV